jgi:Protein of unknown function (DUF3800)
MARQAQSSDDTQLTIQPDALVFYADETGDPIYGNPCNPVFGLGGCAVHGREIVDLIAAPWSHVRTAIGRSPTARLHAAEVERRLTKRKEAAIRQYFNTQPIRRFAVISSHETAYDRVGELSDQVVWTMARLMLNRIVEFAKRTTCSSVIVIFEDNAHLIPMLASALADVEFVLDGTGVPRRLIWCHMPKSVGDPGLEVADFVIHTVAGYCRSGRDPQGKFAARFSSMFGPTDERLVSFMEIADVSYQPPANVSAFAG